MKKGKTGYIDGPFYPWLAEMGKSPAMQKLRKNSEAVNVLTMYITKYTRPNDGKSLCVTYREASSFMSTSTFAKAKLWCVAFGFLHCTEFGRLERHPSIYELSTKWRHLSKYPEKLNYIERRLKKHDKVLRIPLSNIRERFLTNHEGDKTPTPAKVRKRMAVWKIEMEMLSQ